jgi:hypothetical protein
MSALLRTRVTLIWSVLIAATILSWEMGHGFGSLDVRHAGVIIILVAFIKVRFVILDFMEIRNAPLYMRLVGEAWVVLLCSTLCALFWSAPSGI